MMARPLRIEFAGAVYHVTSRGNGRQRLFLDDQDNLKFLELFSSGIGMDSPWSQLQSRLFLGKEAFIDQLKDAIPEKTAVQEIPKLQRYVKR